MSQHRVTVREHQVALQAASGEAMPDEAVLAEGEVGQDAGEDSQDAVPPEMLDEWIALAKCLGPQQLMALLRFGKELAPDAICSIADETVGFFKDCTFDDFTRLLSLKVFFANLLPRTAGRVDTAIRVAGAHNERMTLEIQAMPGAEHRGDRLWFNWRYTDEEKPVPAQIRPRG